jgi:hypothetical protein
MDTRKNDILDDALAAWRSTHQEETLSGAARTALFDEVRSIGDGQEEMSFVPALTRAWRWAFLGSVPVIAIAAVLISAGDHHPVSVMSRLSATKVDGQVVFTLANGGTNHMVYRSTDPQEFRKSSAVKMAGNRFTDETTGGPNLVFYRID